ncbi:hypothetical protein A6A04_19905 [Paramagnetospirillum marisnigri]|uniref:histidine kinase n=2 Tax=Paramagnetospirillum marisnigri TaxID=1285242 RepID=A0A178MJ28_9PROT|nr:hypothetical protein A6A04_19905 [Paramagnetospirillum marisnigri]
MHASILAVRRKDAKYAVMAMAFALPAIIVGVRVSAMLGISMVAIRPNVNSYLVGIGHVSQGLFMLAGLRAQLRQLIRERDHARAALAEAEQKAELEKAARLGQTLFLSMMSHEARTPLSIIDTAAQMIRLGGEAVGPSTLSKVDKIRQAVARILSTFEMCTLEDELQHANMSPDMSSMDLAALTRKNCAEILRPQFDGRLQLSVPDAAHAVTDARYFSVILSNLTDNALKYSDQPIEVRMNVEEDDVVLCVVDSGPGMRQDDLPRIFERYCRLPETAHVAGTGLGLHIVRQLADKVGARIAVESSEGIGTRVFVRFPRSKPAAP